MNIGGLENPPKSNETSSWKARQVTVANKRYSRVKVLGTVSGNKQDAEWLDG